MSSTWPWSWLALELADAPIRQMSVFGTAPARDGSTRPDDTGRMRTLRLWCPFG
jgi:hypothetical protein